MAKKVKKEVKNDVITVTLYFEGKVQKAKVIQGLVNTFDRNDLRITDLDVTREN